MNKALSNCYHAAVVLKIVDKSGPNGNHKDTTPLTQSQIRLKSSEKKHDIHHHKTKIHL